MNLFRRPAAALCALTFSATTALAAEPVEVNSRIQAVTVFPSGAEVVREGQVQIDPATTLIVFRDLPAETVPGSIRVEGKAAGGLEIGAVDTRRLFVPQHSGADAETEPKRIEKEIEALEGQRQLAEAKVSAADTQRTLIGNLTNLPSRPLPSGPASPPSENWSEIIKLIETSLADVARSRIEAEVAQRDLERRIEDLRGKLAAVAPNREERTEVKVAVKTDKPVDAMLTVRYQVPNASWAPNYDARLDSGTKTKAPSLLIVRRATITQRTGEPWENVAIELSTTRPSAGTAAPELDVMAVNYPPEPPPPAPVAAKTASGQRFEAARSRAMAPQAMEAPADAAAAPVSLQEAKHAEATVEVGAFQATYTAPGRATVMNTGEAKSLDLMSDTYAPALIARTTPKRDAKAYLYAKLEVPRGSPVLPGTVALFRDGTFVGNGKLPQLAGGEKHELGFGTDDLVRVRHAVVQEKRGETGLISSSKTDERNYRISVKNMHERAIDLSVFDQLPVSRNEEIKVTQLGQPQPTQRDVDGKTGVLRWDARVEPDEEKVIEFGYRVTWPTDKIIQYQGR